MAPRDGCRIPESRVSLNYLVSLLDPNCQFIDAAARLNVLRLRLLTHEPAYRCGFIDETDLVIHAMPLRPMFRAYLMQDQP